MSLLEQDAPRAIVEDALALAQRGFAVHPCRPEDKRPYTLWTKAATTTPAKVKAFWQRWPDALIAVVTGNGLVVVDDDRGGDVPDASLPATLTSRTRSRGFHHWYLTDARNVPCSVGQVALGVDIRADSGYCIAPPSPGWEWLDADAPLAKLPSVLLAAILKRRSSPSNSFEPRAHVAAGTRHDYLVRFAGFALSNELADNVADLTSETYHHALRVCDPWPTGELPAV